MERRFQEVIEVARKQFNVEDGDRVYPVLRVRDRALVGVYIGGWGWAWRLAERARVIMVQGHPVAIR